MIQHKFLWVDRENIQKENRLPIGQINANTQAETISPIPPSPPQSKGNPKVKTPLVKLIEGQFHQHNVSERIVQIEVFSCRDIQILTEKNRRLNVDCDTLKLPLATDESQLKAYLDNVSLLATQFLSSDEYILRARVKGPGGGAGSSTSNPSHSNASQKPKKFDVDALPPDVQQRFKDFKKLHGTGSVSYYLEVLVNSRDSYVISCLLAAGANPNFSTSKSTSFPECPFLMHAIYAYVGLSIDVVRTIINGGADVNIKYKKIPLVFWVLRDVRHFSIKSDRLKSNNEDNSAQLHLLEQTLDVLNLLLRSGVDPHSKLLQDIDISGTGEKLKAGTLLFHLSGYVGPLVSIIKAGLILANPSEFETMRHAGDKLKKGSESAMLCWKCAAEQGDVEAQYKVGCWYLLDMTTEPNPAQAQPWLQKAADQHHTRAQIKLCELYEAVTGIAKNDAEALQWLQKEADKGHVIAQIYLALRYAGGKGVPKNDAESAKWLERASTSEDANALAVLGNLYYHGVRVPCDYAKAGPLLHKSAEKNSPLGQSSLGLWYSEGRASPEDLKKAIQWFEKAARQGDETAQHELGICHMVGRGVDADAEAGLRWVTEAAENGHAEAQFLLGGLYEDGAGVRKDANEALKWYRKSAKGLQKAADNGSPTGQFKLGVYYEAGKGGLKNGSRSRKTVHKSS